MFLRHLWATDGSVTVNKNGRGGRVYYASTSRQLVDDVVPAAAALRHLVPHPAGQEEPATATAGRSTSAAATTSAASSGRSASTERAARPLSGLLEIVRGLSGNTNVDTIPTQVWERVRDVLAERGMSHRAFAAAMGSAFCGSTHVEARAEP